MSSRNDWVLSATYKNPGQTVGTGGAFSCYLGSRKNLSRECGPSRCRCTHSNRRATDSAGPKGFLPSRGDEMIRERICNYMLGPPPQDPPPIFLWSKEEDEVAKMRKTPSKHFFASDTYYDSVLKRQISFVNSGRRSRKVGMVDRCSRASLLAY